MNLAQVIIASASGGNRAIVFPSPGSNSPSNTQGTSPPSQGTPYDPGGYADSVPTPATTGFIRRGYAGYWANQGSYNDDNPSIFNGTVLDTQGDSYIAFGTQDNSDAFCMEWKGWFKPNATAAWNFYTSADDVCMLWIGNAAFSPDNSNWTSKSSIGLNYNSVNLIQDKWYPIRVRFQEWGGSESCGVFAAPADSELIALYQYGWANMGYCISTDGY